MPLPTAVLQTPHSGFHWPGGLLTARTRRFFEGWYYRVSLPACGESFAFMYSIEDPAGGAKTSGGFAQVLGPGDKRSYCLLDVAGFWAERDRLACGHWQVPAGEPGYLDPDRFFEYVKRGYQATDTLNQGCIEDEAGQVTRWEYRIRPVHEWGRPGRPTATMGLLSYLPVFEPGWQVLMAHGLATGWVEWQGERFNFEDAPAYAEKNWGGAFPNKWFWVQANSFEGHPGTALVVGGGLRGVLWWDESVAMVGLYHEGQFYRFMPGEASITCSVAPWGDWQIQATNDRYRVEVHGSIGPTGGIDLLAPTLEGPRFICRDTLLGNVEVRLSQIGAGGRDVVATRTQLGGLETGGGPWDGRWSFTC